MKIKSILFVILISLFSYDVFALEKLKPGIQEHKSDSTSYFAYIPKGYTEEKKFPVIILMHGLGGNGEFFLSGG